MFNKHEIEKVTFSMPESLLRASCSPSKMVLYSLISEARANRLQAPRIFFMMPASASACVTRAHVIQTRHSVRKLCFKPTTRSCAHGCARIATETHVHTVLLQPQNSQNYLHYAVFMVNKILPRYQFT